jgi:hypothetical protein
VHNGVGEALGHLGAVAQAEHKARAPELGQGGTVGQGEEESEQGPVLWVDWYVQKICVYVHLGRPTGGAQRGRDAADHGEARRQVEDVIIHGAAGGASCLGTAPNACKVLLDRPAGGSTTCYKRSS